MSAAGEVCPDGAKASEITVPNIEKSNTKTFCDVSVRLMAASYRLSFFVNDCGELIQRRERSLITTVTYFQMATVLRPLPMQAKPKEKANNVGDQNTSEWKLWLDATTDDPGNNQQRSIHGEQRPECGTQRIESSRFHQHEYDQ